mgnify:CR=1 FL=1
MKKFKAVVDGKEYEIELELIEDDGKGVKAAPSGLLKRESKKTPKAAPAEKPVEKSAEAPKANVEPEKKEEAKA